MNIILFKQKLLDCKTVRVFAYSSTREQSNKRSRTSLKTESETGERRSGWHDLPSNARAFSFLAPLEMQSSSDFIAAD